MKKLNILTLILTLIILFTSCTANNSSESHDITSDETDIIQTEEYTLPLEEGFNQLTLYWTYSGTYENCDVWMWWDGKAGCGYTFHECDYGGKTVVNVPEGIEKV